MICLNARWHVTVEEFDGAFWWVAVANTGVKMYFRSRAFMGCEDAWAKMPIFEVGWSPIGVRGWEVFSSTSSGRGELSIDDWQ